MNLLILGPQGSGKGTQAKLLAKKFKLPKVSIGQLYREQIQKQSPIGKKAEKYVLKGELVPIRITKEILYNEFTQKKYTKGIILDGYPRNWEQARFLEKLISVDYAIVVKIPEKVTIKRLSSRRVCEKCGETFNINVDKNKKCSCGGKLIRRKDDYPKAIKERLSIYNKDTKPILEKYRKKGKLIEVNGNASINEVFYRIVFAINEVKND